MGIRSLMQEYGNDLQPIMKNLLIWKFILLNFEAETA